MSDKLGHNKVLTTSLLLAMIFFLSCAKLPNSSVQIDCPTAKSIIVIENVTQNDVYMAAQDFLIKKHTQKTKDTYTALKFKDGRAVMMKDIPPEEFNRCIIIEMSMAPSGPR